MKSKVHKSTLQKRINLSEVCNFCALLFKCVWPVRVLSSINAFIQWRFIKLIKSDSEYIYDVTKDLNF